MASSIQDWSLYSVPAAFTLAMLPHVYMNARLIQATKGRISNAVYVHCFPSPPSPFHFLHSLCSATLSGHCLFSHEADQDIRLRKMYIYTLVTALADAFLGVDAIFKKKGPAAI